MCSGACGVVCIVCVCRVTCEQAAWAGEARGRRIEGRSEEGMCGAELGQPSAPVSGVRLAPASRRVNSDQSSGLSQQLMLPLTSGKWFYLIKEKRFDLVCDHVCPSPYKLVPVRAGPGARLARGERREQSGQAQVAAGGGELATSPSLSLTLSQSDLHSLSQSLPLSP